MTEEQKEPKPWDRQPDESDEAYARFLAYCVLGPGRSLDAAYRLSNPVATNSSKTRGNAKTTRSHKADDRRASGQWTQDSVNFHWRERATAFDIEMLTEVGRSVVVKYVGALDLAFGRVLAALQSEKMMPRSWNQVLESLTTLGNFIPQETVSTIRQDSEDDSVPAFGASSGEKTEST